MFSVTDKERTKGRGREKGAGVMKDKELKIEEIETSHTLGGTGELVSRGENFIYYEQMK